MKVKSLFVAMMALATLASCNNEDDAVNVEAGTPKSVRLSLDYASTRAIGDTAKAGRPTLSNIQVLAYSDEKCEGNLLGKTMLSAEEAETLSNSNGTVVVSIHNAAKGVKMVANNGSATLPPNEIESYQGKDIKTEIPYVGLSKIDGNETAGYTAAITIAPQVARIEVLGHIKATDDANGCTVTIDGIYMNKYRSHLSSPAIVTLKSDNGETITSATSVTGMFDTSSATNWGDAVAENPTKCAAYQVFAGDDVDTYGVVLAVTMTPNDGTKVKKGFVVIKKFKDINKLSPAHIYRLNLTNSGLENEFDYPNTDPITPDPSGEEKQITVTVNVEPWAEQTVIPEI